MAISLKRYTSQVQPSSKSGAIPISSGLEELLVKEAGAEDRLMQGVLKEAGKAGADIYQSFVKDRDEANIAEFERDYKIASGQLQEQIKRATNKDEVNSLLTTFERDQRNFLQNVKVSPGAEKKLGVAFESNIAANKVLGFSQNLKIDTNKIISGARESYNTAIETNDFDLAQRSLEQLRKAGGISIKEMSDLTSSFDANVASSRRRRINDQRGPINQYKNAVRDQIEVFSRRIANSDNPQEMIDISFEFQEVRAELEKNLTPEALEAANAELGESIRNFDTKRLNRRTSLLEGANIATELSIIEGYIDRSEGLPPDAINSAYRLHELDPVKYSEDWLKGKVVEIEKVNDKVTIDRLDAEQEEYRISGDASKAEQTSLTRMEVDPKYKKADHIKYMENVNLKSNAREVTSLLKQNKIKEAKDFFERNDFSQADSLAISTAIFTTQQRIKEDVEDQQAKLFNSLATKYENGEVVDLNYELASGSIRIGGVEYPALTDNQVRELTPANITKKSQFTSDQLNLSNRITSQIGAAIKNNELSDQAEARILLELEEGKITGLHYLDIIKGLNNAKLKLTPDERELLGDMTEALPAFLSQQGTQRGVTTHLELMDQFIDNVVGGNISINDFKNTELYQNYIYAKAEYETVTSKADEMDNFLNQVRGQQ